MAEQKDFIVDVPSTITEFEKATDKQAVIDEFVDAIIQIGQPKELIIRELFNSKSLQFQDFKDMLKPTLREKATRKAFEEFNDGDVQAVGELIGWLSPPSNYPKSPLIEQVDIEVAIKLLEQEYQDNADATAKLAPFNIAVTSLWLNLFPIYKPRDIPQNAPFWTTLLL